LRVGNLATEKMMKLRGTQPLQTAAAVKAAPKTAAASSTPNLYQPISYTSK